MPGAVLLGSLDQPLDLPLGQVIAASLATVTFTEVEALSRSGDFSMEIASRWSVLLQI
jgi:hypothetical protein